MNWLKKQLAVLLSVLLITSSVPLKAEASVFSDILGVLFTAITAPIWIFCPDNPTFRKNNPFRKKAWQEADNFYVNHTDEEEREKERKSMEDKFTRYRKIIDNKLNEMNEKLNEEKRNSEADKAIAFHPQYSTDHIKILKIQGEVLAKQQEFEEEEEVKKEPVLQYYNPSSSLKKVCISIMTKEVLAVGCKNLYDYFIESYLQARGAGVKKKKFLKFSGHTLIGIAVGIFTYKDILFYIFSG